ncbi:triacylglycerol lipase [Acinetobacter suaedae]|uniref:Triacylglycerol lipase n=1 Tax=Acinetobacter suaedae TaxID=2609668 RepID=A0A5P1UUP9_9GAMM|nr:triacylglycerol lipase [Acinetobacter sp. C16S1]QER39892.1 triacylglycerol lipase [Acinetobacter sp. C16S1]
MKKKYLNAIVLTTGMLISGGSVVHAGLFSFLSPKASWQNCDVKSCSVGGSTNVTSSYAKTKYPIVLAHGMSGFSAVGPLQYWHGITEDLVSNGANVFVTQQAAFNSSEVRGEQLLLQTKQILAISGAEKVNLVGHSHGTHSIRYVAGLMPEKVASVTAVAGPGKGSDVADAVYDFTQSPVGPVAAPVISAGVNAFGALIGIGSGNYYDQDSLAGLWSLTTAGAAEFNQRFPAGIPTAACGSGRELESNGVRYYSWTGISPFTNALDPFDYALTATSLLIPGDSDGLVPRCSSHLGTVIRDNYAFNHLDEVNQVLGLVGFLQNPVTPFRLQANRLKNLNL